MALAPTRNSSLSTSSRHLQPPGAQRSTSSIRPALPLTAVNNNGQQISAIAGDSIDVEATKETTDTAPAPVGPAAGLDASTAGAPIVIVYGASIAGRVTGLEIELAIEAAQVCATQPLVLHQSCATTTPMCVLPRGFDHWQLLGRNCRPAGSSPADPFQARWSRRR